MNDVVIREAEFKDIQDLVAMAEAFYAFAGLADHGQRYSEENFRQLLADFAMSAQGVCLVAVVGGVLIGSISGVVSLWYLDRSQKTAIEQWLWVQADVREGLVGSSLVEAFERWAVAQGCGHVIMAGLTAGVSGFYARRGYIPIETHYIKEV